MRPTSEPTGVGGVNADGRTQGMEGERPESPDPSPPGESAETGQQQSHSDVQSDHCEEAPIRRPIHSFRPTACGKIEA